MVSFNKFRDRLRHTHGKKFRWLLRAKISNDIKTIKPINFAVVLNKESMQPIKFTQNHLIELSDSSSLKIHIDPKDFSNNSFHPLEHTDKKWIINLTGSSIPSYVSNLLQLGNNFCLPTKDKKTAIHEFIKDIECSFKRNIMNLTTIRNVAIPQFGKFLHTKHKKDVIQQKLLEMHKATKKFCRDNPNIIFTRADKGNITVALDRMEYTTKVDMVLGDKNSYSLVKKKSFVKN